MYPLWQHNYLTKAVAFLNGKKFLVCSSQKNHISCYIILYINFFSLSLSPNFVLFYGGGRGREVSSCCSPLFCFCCLLLDFNTVSSLLSLSVIMAH